MAGVHKTSELVTQEDNTTRSLSASSSSAQKNSSANIPTSTSSPLPPSVARLWRPAALRNLRNQWSKLAACRQRWESSCSNGRSHATSLVNAFLSQRYMPSMELGVLKDMWNIRKKASRKLLKQQELHRSKLLSSYQDMVAAVLDMVNARRSMRCYLKQTNSPLVQFSSNPDEKDDPGDGGGVPVFTFWSVAFFEKLAQELIEMFELELSLKRLLVLELLCAGCEEAELMKMNWSNELYPGEFDHLAVCNLYSEVDHKILSPKLKGQKSDMPSRICSSQPSHETLQVYLTTWLAEVNVDSPRVQEIFAIVSEEMRVCFL